MQDLKLNNEFLEDFFSNEPLYILQKKYNVSYHKLRKLFNDEEFETRKKSKNPRWKKRNEELINDYKNNFSLKYLQKKHNISKQRIFMILEEYNVERQRNFKCR